MFHEILPPMDLSNALSYAMLPKPLQVPYLPSAHYVLGQISGLLGSATPVLTATKSPQGIIIHRA